MSSDFCRKLICDDENDQSATSQAFGLLHFIVSRRLSRGRLTAVDATNVRRSDRAAMLRIAARMGRPTVAVIFEAPLELCLARNAGRAERSLRPEVVTAQHLQMPAAADLYEEGFSTVAVCDPAGRVTELPRA